MGMTRSRVRSAGRTGAAILLMSAVATLGSVGVRTVIAAGAASDSAPLQSGRNLERPPTWKVRYDEGGRGERGYVVMRPGWHINPGPAGIFWDPGRFATGNYSVTSTIFLFPPGQGEPPSQVEAAYGLLLAGNDLEDARPAYVSFMLRNDGAFRVARHVGEEIREVVGWSPHEAIVTWSEATEGTAKNVLAVDVTEEAVVFWVNDQEVWSTPRADLALEGTVGVRAGEGLSLHISDMAIGPNRR